MTTRNKPTSSIRFGRAVPTIPVTDISKAQAFYIEKLGMQKTFENGQPVGFVILRRDDAKIHLTLDPAHQPSTRNIAHIIVNDARALYDELEQAGVRIIKGIRDEEYGLRDFIIADLDGNRIDIGQRIQG